MTKSFVILLLCFSSAYSESNMKMDMATMPEKSDDMSMMDSMNEKSKRDSWPIQSTPCPPLWPLKGWQAPEQPKVQFIQQPSYIQKPTVTILKSEAPSYQPVTNPWQQNAGWNKYGWSKPTYGWPVNSGWKSPGWQSSGWQSPGWQSSGWQSPGWQSSGWQSPGWQPSGWKPKVIVQKPVTSYVPQYQKPSYQVIPNYQSSIIKTIGKPDCPPYPHQHSTGIVYAPQHQYQHQPQIKYIQQEPQYVKIAKPVYQPPVYHSSPVYLSNPGRKVEICD